MIEYLSEVLADVTNATKRTVAQALRMEGFLIPYVVFCAFCAVAAELTMEIWGFGFESAKPLLSERHAILGLVLAAAAALLGGHVVALLRQGSRARDLRRRLRLQLEALPFAGKGVRFLALTAGLNFAFGVLAQCGERAHDLDGDAFGWLISALIVAVLMATVPAVAGSIAASVIRPENALVVAAIAAAGPLLLLLPTVVSKRPRHAHQG